MATKVNNMRVIILGASGRVGQQTVKRALEKGHHVTAFVRDPKSIQILHPQLEVIKGDAMSQGDVSQAMKGQDAVISCLSSSEHSHRMVFIHHIINAMREHKVKRIIAIGGIGALQANEHLKVYETATFPREYVDITQAHIRVLDALLTSRYQFTFVCPPMIPDGDRTGVYRVQADYPAGGWSITSGDIADFMVLELEKGAFINKRVGISNHNA
jgi:uncharacterized protein